MEKQLALSLKTHLAFPHLKDAPPIRQYADAFDALERSCADFCAAYAALFQFHLEEGDVVACIQKTLLTDDNAFARSSQTTELSGMNPSLKEAVSFDLHTLQALCSFRADDLLRSAQQRFPMHAPYLNALPRFPQVSGVSRLSTEALYSLYREKGYGFFAGNTFFVWEDRKPAAVTHADPIRLGDLIGYQKQKELLLQNTRAFLQRGHAQNALLYGDKGTGKSSTVKAIGNEFSDQKLKFIELKCDQIQDYPHLLNTLENSPFRFVLFLDDLSFPEESANFSMLKTVMQGSLYAQPENLIIYATSNRRHIIREYFSNRAGDDVHLRDTLSTNTALSDRFGLEVTFSTPDRAEYFEIVEALAKKEGIDMHVDELHLLCERFALKRGGRSPRTAQQFITQLKQEAVR